MSTMIQQSEEWFEYRRTRIGGSDAAIILGLSPWKTPYQLFMEKVFNIKTETTYRMKRGLELEDTARHTFEELTGLVVYPRVIEHPKYKWMIASLDGMDIEEENIVEIKCPSKADHQYALNGNVPEKYYPQLQHQMAVCQLKYAYYFSFDGKKGVYLKIERDETFIKNMIDQEKKFWDCLQTLTPPEMTERDLSVKNDDLWKELSNQWIDTNKKIKELEKKESEIRQSLISMCQNKNSTGAGIRVNKVIRKGVVDYGAIPELENVNLEMYRKSPLESWRIYESNGI